MPAATPKPIVARFNAATLEVANRPEIRDKLVALGFATTTTSSEQFARDLARRSGAGPTWCRRRSCACSL
jgi:tripartite-type tricarboxylate transporter receptor subunit TctC